MKTITADTYLELGHAYTVGHAKSHIDHWNRLPECDRRDLYAIFDYRVGDKRMALAITRAWLNKVDRERRRI